MHSNNDNSEEGSQKQDETKGVTSQPKNGRPRVAGNLTYNPAERTETEEPNHHQRARPWKVHGKAYLRMRKRRLQIWWNAKRPNLRDRKFSLSQAIFSIALIFVGSVQAFVYFRQAADNRAVQRAFVNASDLRVERIIRTVNGAPVKFWRFTQIISNGGSTPTVDLRYISGVRTYWNGAWGLSGFSTSGVFHTQAIGVKSPAPAERIQFPDDPGALLDSHKRRIFTFIGAHGTRQISWVEVPEDNFHWSVQNGWRSFFYGEVVYRDVFDKSIEHVTKFCFLLTGEDQGNGFEARSSLCDYWNCADQECKDSKTRYDQDVAAEKAAHPGPLLPPDAHTAIGEFQ